MPHFICTACGTQYAESAHPPAQCLICEEERQYVPPRGQTWTTPGALAQAHVNSYREYEPGVIGLATQPHFAIGQRAILVRTPAGNVLWDCISLLDAATVTLINGLGGIKAIAISHPHFYTAMV
ncbi:MAG TPA: MBL fold metallo-hydrolase, partial [Pseudolabrys sp.]|nr:MBL fold metallo-hydrolase [Pseudolabrys sp.]